MGCGSSKHVKATVDVYRPAPTSFAVFDISAIKEPWLMVEDVPQEHDEKQPPAKHVPPTILDKLEDAGAPRSWDEVSKALRDHLKPTVTTVKSAPATKPEAAHPPAQVSKQTPRKSFSFHTLEELDAKLSSKKNPASELRKTESMRTERKNPPASTTPSTGFKSVKDNIFVVRDRLEREKEGKKVAPKWDPLSDFPEKCPPGGVDSVVVYTTSLRGVRRTYEDCTLLRSLLEGHQVVFDERDVSLHGDFLNELRELAGEEASVPRLFVKGRYLGGVEEVTQLNETGRLGRVMAYARVERGVLRQACEGCGGASFVPCLDCGGSCKVFVDGDKKERCSKCNENGLVYCPACRER